MPKAAQLKKFQIVKIDGGVYSTLQIQVKTPSARGAATLYKVRFDHVQTHQKLDKTYKGTDFIEDADLDRARVQFLYQDGNSFVFMRQKDYSQFTLEREQIEDQWKWLTEGLEDIDGLFLDGILIGIVLPHTVELEVVETAPSVKGASATARTKPARLSTGAEVQVPEYLETGEIIKINTETGTYMSRA